VGRRRKILTGLGALVVAGALAGPLAPRAEAAGIITHSWMAAEAIPLVSDPALRALLRAHADDVEGGAHFPDSGYAAGVVGVEDDYGEEAHWPRFHNALADQIATQCAATLTQANGPCARRIAHLFGAVAHGMGDEVWDWLFEPNGPDHGESYVPPDLQDQFSNGGLEMQMDLIAIGDYDRRTSPDVPEWPSPRRLAGAFAAVHRPDVSVDDMALGRTAIDVARRGERSLTQRFHNDITRHMRWTSSHIYTAPGGVRFAARAIAAAWDNLWARMHGEQPATSVSVTYPADGQVDIPITGWDRETFLPGSSPDRGGGRNRITAVLDASLPYEPFADTPGSIDGELPPGSMTVTQVDGEVPVPIREHYPRQVPYGPDSGEHVIDIQPDANLLPCTQYRVDVTSALLDLDQQPVTPYSWTFTTDGCNQPRHQPDLSAKRGNSGAIVGDDVYTAGGAGQSRLVRAAPGSRATFFLRIGNDGNEPDRFRVTGQGTVRRRFAVQYYDGNRKVTGQVVAGTYRTPTLNPGGVRTLRVTVDVLSTAPRGAATTRLVTAQSADDNTMVDGYRLTVRRASAARTRADAEAAAAPPLTDAELAEAARYAQVCVLG
jgi:hypothetical protein